MPTISLEHLARDPDARVRTQIACSPDLPPRVADALAGDDDPFTRKNVRRRYWDVLAPHARDARLADDARKVRLAALLMRARNEVGVARALLDAGVSEFDVATHCVLDADVSAQLVQSDDSHKGCGLRRLADDPWPTARELAACDPEAPARYFMQTLPRQRRAPPAYRPRGGSG